MDICEVFSTYRRVSQNTPFNTNSCSISPDSILDYTDSYSSSRVGVKEAAQPTARKARFLSWTTPRKVSDVMKWCGFDGPADDGLVDRPPMITTLPRSRSSRQSPIMKRPPLLTNFSSQSYSPLSARSSRSRRLPDRFLPLRPSSGSVVESFRANKDLRALTPEERLTRSESASPDAFYRQRSATSPTVDSPRPIPRRNFSGNRSGSGGGTVLTLQRNADAPAGERQVSIGTVWRVGGLAPVTGVPDGRGGLLGSGTNAPLYTTTFSATKPRAQEDLERLEGRLAEALEINRVSRILQFRHPCPVLDSLSKKTKWDASECQWITSEFSSKLSRTEEIRTLPLAPFKVLDAPNLRDDFYCSILAYSSTSHTLAVGLGPLLYAWSEVRGVHLLNAGPANGSWLTSLAFSSSAGKKSILAFGRSDGSLTLMSLYDNMLPRFEIHQPSPVACITWRPQISFRPSRKPTSSGNLVQTEDLVVGDEGGNIYYYSVEWPESWEVNRHGWSGSMTLLVRISVHTQQICGLSFSRDGTLFATGGNDNLCCLFQTSSVLHRVIEEAQGQDDFLITGDGSRRVHTLSGLGAIKEVKLGAEKHKWIHGAAVKAIAFCPWKDGLVATGGGSNDKCIHFFHATSGTCLATVSVSAQVTSLIWSNTRREICATFGYAQPEHPFRIAVFSWPECKQVAAIPWEGEHRALYAIPYPGGPNESQTSREGGGGLSRTAQEGCIVVASSDESVKFHEVWTGNKKATSPVKGLLGGSDVIEGLESIDKEGEIIR